MWSFHDSLNSLEAEDSAAGALPSVLVRDENGIGASTYFARNNTIQSENCLYQAHKW